MSKLAIAADWKGIWALTWRSLAYAPIALAIWALLIFWVMALVYLPVQAIAFAAYGVYNWAAGALALWLPVLWLGSRPRILTFVFRSADRGVEKCKRDTGMTV